MDAPIWQVAEPTQVIEHIFHSAPPSKTTPPFRFLDLPAEIRVMIYKVVLVVGKVFYTPDAHDIWIGKRCRGHVLFRKPELQLLRLCKQIHAEAEHVYLSKNLFVLPTDWYQCQPFKELDEFRIRDLSSNARHLFSPAGLSHVKNISISVDQNMAQCKGMTVNDWKIRELMYGELAFAQLSADKRRERAHNHMRHAIVREWRTMTDRLNDFRDGLDYIEMDFSNAFCPLGDCRPIEFVIDVWIKQIAPGTLDLVGLEIGAERNWFIIRAEYYLDLTDRQLVEKHGLRFREIGQYNNPWDKGMMKGEVTEYEIGHDDW